jgi:hypothetical protein
MLKNSCAQTLLGLGLLLVSATATAQTLTPITTQPKDWRVVAKEDIEAVYQSTTANHPGMVDPLNPKFADSLNAAKQAALKYANQFNSAAGYKFALGALRAKLNDGHAGVYTRVPADWLAVPRWPGFVTTWRADGLFVSKSTLDKLAVGSRVIDCDGQPIEQIIKTNVFTFYLSADQPGLWWSEASRVFVDEGNPFVRLPARCTVELADRKQSIEINWQDAPMELKQWRQETAFGAHLATGVTQPAPGITWISLPNFNPSVKEMPELERLYKALQSKDSPLKSARAVVIDLRGNQGGSSNWSVRLAKLFWGKAAAEAHLAHYQRNVQILWRPSEGNEGALKALLPILKQQGDLDTIDEIKKLISKMPRARADNRALLPEKANFKPDSVKKPTKALAFANKKNLPLYVVTDGACVSACLDAIDVFKLYGKTILVGSPTSSDSTYMEVRSDPLPSGLGATIIPMKIWVDRPRGNGQFYAPDIVVNDLPWSTENFVTRIQDHLTNLK